MQFFLQIEKFIHDILKAISYYQNKPVSSQQFSIFYGVV